jgi:hypothetical protein
VIETERAWQAGIIDGEGCISISRQMRNGRPSPAFRVFITISNTDLRILAPFQIAWRGKIRDVHERRGDKRGVKWADAFEWYCPESQQRPFLLAILPYLRSKQRQAILALDFIDHKKSFKRYHGSAAGGNRGGSAPLGQAEIAYRETVWHEIRCLNTKGTFARNQAAAGVGA